MLVELQRGERLEVRCVDTEAEVSLTVEFAWGDDTLRVIAEVPDSSDRSGTIYELETR